jgi:hypothetical protein
MPGFAGCAELLMQMSLQVQGLLEHFGLVSNRVGCDTVGIEH